MLIKFLGFIFLFVLVLIIIGVFILYRTVRMFLSGNRKSQSTYTQNSQRSQAGRQSYQQQATQKDNNDDTTSYESYHGSKEWYASPGRKKIFGEDEGEYIDFEEIKE